MRYLYTLIVVFAVVGFSFATEVPRKKAPAQKKQQKIEVATQQLVEATTPQPPPPPPTPEQGPSSPPEVTYQGGQLVIVARNSTMGDVLNEVKQKTGAAVEMPAASSERVVGKFGPGAPRDVMAQLLNGSHFDYVLLGSPADPGALKKVVLIARVSGPQPPNSQQQRQAGYRNPAFQQNPNLQAVPEVQNDAPVEENNPDVSQDAQQPEQEQPPDQAQPDEAQPDQSQPEQQPTVKTPEQLLRELQQQQQQQEQQNAPPGTPPQ